MLVFPVAAADRSSDDPGRLAAGCAFVAPDFSVDLHFDDPVDSTDLSVAGFAGRLSGADRPVAADAGRSIAAAVQPVAAGLDSAAATPAAADHSDAADRRFVVVGRLDVAGPAVAVVAGSIVAVARHGFGPGADAPHFDETHRPAGAVGLEPVFPRFDAVPQPAAVVALESCR